LWERQQKNATSNAVAKRQQSAVSLPALRRAATTSNITALPSQAQINVDNTAPYNRDGNKDTNSFNEQEYYSQGLSAYHSQGW